MADPSPHFSWQVPSVGVSSWHQTVNSVFHAIDARVASIAQLLRFPTCTTVVSFMAVGAGVQFPRSAETVGVFRLMSSAPYGRFVGSFTVRHPTASTLLFDLRAALVNSCVAVTQNDMRVRLVVNPGSIAIGPPTTGILWRTSNEANTRAVHLQYTGWAVASLGAGKFSVGIDQLTAHSAAFGMHGIGGWLQLTVYETP